MKHFLKSYIKSILVLTILLLYLFLKEEYNFVLIGFLVIWFGINVYVDRITFTRKPKPNEYFAGGLYFIKSLTQIALAALGLFGFDLVAFIMSQNVHQGVIITINIIFCLILLYFIFMIATSKTPSFLFSDNGFKYKYKQVAYSDIDKIIPAKGGSEPELVFKNGSTLVLELSWFLKNDRTLILKTITDNIAING